tara:strand:- start:68 stop:601 length:534 start_codon:yes stop_codon:yes gene_type:complete
MSQLKVNSIVPAGGLLSGASGGIIQIVQVVKTDTFSESLNQGVISSDTGLNVTITPSSNSNKILIIASVSMSCSNDNRNCILLYKGGSVLSNAIGDADGSRTRVSCASFNSATSFMSNLNINFLDAPSTTSATTYGIRLKHGRNNNATVFLNRASDQGSGSDRDVAASFITAMEVSG